MKITRRFVSFATQALNPPRLMAAAKRKAIRVEVLAIGLLLMPVLLVIAKPLPFHAIFDDVRDGSFYHDAVAAITMAGIITRRG
jgi:hypothetical protein